MADDFIPPKPTPALRSMLYNCAPALLPILGIAGIEYDPAELERLRALEPYNVLLTPNHPTLGEPVVMFHLSCKVKQPFYFLTAREVFNEYYGVYGWVIQHIGGYSLLRGTIDRESFRKTREILAQQGAKLVVFPEGEVHLQNGTLLPFQSGVFQMAFWGVEEARKAGRPDDPFYIVPVGLRYRYPQDISEEIEISLGRLEQFTGAKREANDDTYIRLRRITLAMLKSLEKEYRITVPKSEDELAEDLTHRLDGIKEAILLRVAAAAGLSAPKGETLIDRMRSLSHLVNQLAHKEPQAATPYDLELSYQQRERAKPLIKDLNRLSNWIAAYDGYIRENPTQARIADTIIRMEKECFGTPKFNQKRQYRVHIGEPLNLTECWPAYETNKRAEVNRVTKVVEGRVAELLEASPVPEGLFK